MLYNIFSPQNSRVECRDSHKKMINFVRLPRHNLRGFTLAGLDDYQFYNLSSDLSSDLIRGKFPIPSFGFANTDNFSLRPERRDKPIDFSY